MPIVTATRRGADRWLGGHPWIYKSDVSDVGTAQAGDTVEVREPRGRFLGTAHYSSTSQIALRFLSARRTELDRSFYAKRIAYAIEHRRRVVENSDAYRLIFSEADELPGLIVDRYGPYLVLQALTQAMDRATPLVVETLVEALRPEGILARNDAQVRKLESLTQEVSVLHGEVPERVPVQVNGLTFEADLRRGQKTGVYLDQRENYVAAAKYAHGRALDCFTSTGGFALHMASKIESVDGIDLSSTALETADRSAKANGIPNVHWREANAFDYLAGMGAKRFDTIVLDPPAFAKNKREIDDAMRGYKEINLRALKSLNPDGVLVTCSCSHHVSEGMLHETVAAAALDAGKRLRVLERRTQASDHPILLTVPETLYLKCLIAQVLPD